MTKTLWGRFDPFFSIADNLKICFLKNINIIGTIGTIHKQRFFEGKRRGVSKRDLLNNATYLVEIGDKGRGTQKTISRGDVFYGWTQGYCLEAYKI